VRQNKNARQSILFAVRFFKTHGKWREKNCPPPLGAHAPLVLRVAMGYKKCGFVVRLKKRTTNNFLLCVFSLSCVLHKMCPEGKDTAKIFTHDKSEFSHSDKRFCMFDILQQYYFS
jgi:hypothetical protein